MKYVLLYITLILGLMYVMIPRTEPVDFFLFSDMKLSLATHVYFIGEKLVLIILAYILYCEDKSEFIKAFLVLMVADLVDYLLTYNSIWFTFVIPISMNVCKVIIFSLLILKQWIGNYSRG